jgi:protein EFR3
LKCREERESPEVWSHICVQKLAELAKESTTLRRILDPMLSYFDMKKQWAPHCGLAFIVLSDMAYLEKSSGILLVSEKIMFINQSRAQNKMN